MDKQLLWLLWARGGDIAAVICCGWAFWKGGLTERLGAAIIAIGWGLSFIFTSKAGNGPGTIVMIIDVVTLLSFTCLALWSRRVWVFFAAAMMLNTVVSHIVPVVTDLGIYNYVTALGLWGGYGLLACLVWGILDYQHLRRKGLT